MVAARVATHSLPSLAQPSGTAELDLIVRSRRLCQRRTKSDQPENPGVVGERRREDAASEFRARLARSLSVDYAGERNPR